MGAALKKAFYSGSGLKKALEDAGVRIFPDAYYSMVGLVFLLTLIISNRSGLDKAVLHTSLANIVMFFGFASQKL